MSKIFSYLALVALTFCAATMIIGLTIGDIRVQPDPDALRWKTIHFLFGLLAAMGVMLVNGIAVTYFIGTSRWCREVVETYHLDSDLIARSTRLKRRAFPWALLSMLTMVAIVAIGAAADPQNTLVKSSARWATPHLVAALAGLSLIAFSCYAQLAAIAEQQKVITDILDQVATIRRERGLDS